MPPKKKAVKKEKTELQKKLEALDDEDFIPESGSNTQVADSLELQLFDFVPDGLGTVFAAFATFRIFEFAKALFQTNQKNTALESTKLVADQ